MGKELPILKHMDVAEQLKSGTWLLVLYHHDCSKCAAAIEACMNAVYEIEGAEPGRDPGIALISVPPHGVPSVGQSTRYLLGELSPRKTWFVMTRTVVLIVDGKTSEVWGNRKVQWSQVLQSSLRGQKDEKRSHPIITKDAKRIPVMGNKSVV